MIQTPASEKDLQLKMAGVSKTFGPVQALRQVDFTLRPATVHAIVGENGAGKSTLMKILSGVYSPDEGTIHYGNKQLNLDTPGRAIEAGISMIYQELDLAEHLTAAENVFLGDEPAGRIPFTVSRNKLINDTKELAEKYGFDIDPAARIEDLTIAQAQIVEILKALARNCSILVMDEPTSSLSQSETRKLFQTVKSLRSAGISVIYISHRLEEIIDLADEVTVLRDGAVVHTDSISNLQISGIIRYMVGRELTDFFPPRDCAVGETKLEVDCLSAQNGIENISFEIHKGEIVGMAGLVGSGRTEIAEAVFGTQKITSGRILSDGNEINIKSPNDAISNSIALLTEDRKRTGLCLNLSCAHNITLPCLENIGMDKIIRPQRELEIVNRSVEKLNIRWAGPKAPADSLSGGNQQKLLIARWLLTGSDVIIFDEPTRGIDVGAKKEIYELINTLAGRGKAILFISSELPELLGMTDRILVVRDKKIAAELETQKTSQQEIMHFAALGDKNEPNH